MRDPELADYVKHGLTPLRFPDGSVVWVAPPSYYEPCIRHREERRAARSRKAPATVSPDFQLKTRRPE